MKITQRIIHEFSSRHTRKKSKAKIYPAFNLNEWCTKELKCLIYIGIKTRLKITMRWNNVKVCIKIQQNMYYGLDPIFLLNV